MALKYQKSKSNGYSLNLVGGITVSVLASSAIDRGFEHRSGETKDYNISICCFSAKHTAVGRHVYLRTVVSVS
jgi:hypothetical protein